MYIFIFMVYLYVYGSLCCCYYNMCFVLYGIVNCCGNGDFFYSIIVIGRWVLLLL